MQVLRKNVKYISLLRKLEGTFLTNDSIIFLNIKFMTWAFIFDFVDIKLSITKMQLTLLIMEHLIKLKLHRK